MLDPSSPWGYERRYVSLHSLHRYQEATEALRELLTKLEESPDPSIRRKPL